MHAEHTAFWILMDEIRRRPPLYLGRRSLSALQAFIHGYSIAKGELGRFEPPLTGFDEFVAKQYHWKGRDTGGWARKIMYFHGDEAESLEAFFKLLDEFRALQAERSRN